VGDVLREVGTTTQAEITKRTGLNSGTVSHALHVLQEEGKAAPTGERQARSLVWEPQA
jgi:DNA-binding IclR family transcriptional regulator